MKVEVKVTQSCLILFAPTDDTVFWDSSGQNTGVGSLSLLQGIFPTQESNQGRSFRQILYELSYQAKNQNIMPTFT